MVQPGRRGWYHGVFILTRHILLSELKEAYHAFGGHVLSSGDSDRGAVVVPYRLLAGDRRLGRGGRGRPAPVERDRDASGDGLGHGTREGAIDAVGSEIV